MPFHSRLHKRSADVDSFCVAVVVVQQSLIHHPAPQWWNPRDHDHHCVAGRKLRRFGRATQTLVPQLRVGVVIAVPLQLVEKQIAHDVIAVPTVSGAGANVRAVSTFAAQQTVMLEVVRRFEEGESGNCLQQEPGRERPTEDTDQRREEDNSGNCGFRTVSGPS